MTPSDDQKQALTASDLTIGDLARRTGLTPAVLRTWETRHGFPVPHRLESGHRRYAESDVSAIEGVLRRREAGTRLEVAIKEAAEPGDRSTTSVFAELRRRHPHLTPHRLRKSTLLALSWAIEDECCARAERPVIIGSFQEGRYFEAAAPRWDELARVAGSTLALADFGGRRTSPDRGAVRVHLGDTAPMRREWAVICDAPDLPAALTAFELPGQQDVKDGERIFESLWTLDPRAVRDASRVAARVAHEAGAPEAGPVLYALADEPPRTSTDIAAATNLFNRIVAYVDRFGR